MSDKIFYFSSFSSFSNDPCYPLDRIILSPLCIRVGCFCANCVKWNYCSHPCSPIQYHCKLYQDPGKGKVIADSVITIQFLYAFKFTGLSILNVVSIDVNDRKFVEKNVY